MAWKMNVLSLVSFIFDTFPKAKYKLNKTTFMNYGIFFLFYSTNIAFKNPLGGFLCRKTQKKRNNLRNLWLAAVASMKRNFIFLNDTSNSPIHGIGLNHDVAGDYYCY